jgi:hypothetical protein
VVALVLHVGRLGRWHASLLLLRRADKLCTRCLVCLCDALRCVALRCVALRCGQPVGWILLPKPASANL